MAGGVAAGLVEVAFADASLEIAALALHAVERAGHAAGGGFFIDIEDDDEIGPDIAAGDAGDGEDFVARHAAGGALVGERAGDEAIGEDEFAGAERGADAHLDELGAAGHVKERFAAERDVFAVGLIGGAVVEEDVADPLADDGAAGLADFADGDGGVAAGLDEADELGGLAGAVGAVEDDEASGEAAEGGGAGVVGRCGGGHGAECMGKGRHRASGPGHQGRRGRRQ